jgi:hypothetical protein
MCKSEHQCFLRNIWAELKSASDLVAQTNWPVSWRVNKKRTSSPSVQTAQWDFLHAVRTQPTSDADRLEAAADQAIAAYGGDAREAVKALIVANHYLETDLEKLKAAASKGYARGKLFEEVPRDRKDWYDWTPSGALLRVQLLTVHLALPSVKTHRWSRQVLNTKSWRLFVLGNFRSQ